MRALSVAVAIALLTGCSSRNASPPAAAPQSGPATGPAISAAELQAHVTLLASDELRGRGTLEPGELQAATYLSDQFQAYGLQPMPGHGKLVVPYALDRAGLSGALRMGAQTWKAGEEFAPFPFSDAGEVEADVVFVGYGITSPDGARDDYAGVDARGKVVLVLRYAPGPDDGPLASSEHAYLTSKAMNAQKHGAVGMLLVTGPRHAREAEDLRLPVRLRLPAKEEDQAKPVVGPVGKKPEPAPPFLALHVSSAIGDAVAGRRVAELQLEVDGGKRAADVKTARATVTMTVVEPSAPERVKAHNVLGFLPGADPARAGEWIVIGAHFDHLGAHAGEGDTIYNGADDNASGTAGLLELAQAFAAGPRPARSILFAAFSGEERGLLGSRALLEQGFVNPRQVVFMMNLDMIGRNDGKPIEVVGDGYSSGMGEIVVAANREAGLPLALGGVDYSGASDHHPFFEADVPVLFFFTGLHEDYHGLSDHADKLAYGRMERIVRVAHDVVGPVAAAAHTPHFIHQLTWLGVAVEVDPARGAVITRVDADSRASRAGFQAGDVIIAVNDVALDSPGEVGARFRAITPGTKFVLGVNRGTEHVTAILERARRGYLGVYPAPVDPATRSKLGLTEDEGVGISGMDPKGPAAAAGIRAGDILVKIGGVPVGPRSLGTHLARIGAGETVQVEVVREGERLTLPLTLAEPPQRP